MSAGSRKIFVRGFPSYASEEDLECYFQSRRACGGDVDEVEIESETRTAIVWFDEEEVTESVCKKKDHELDGHQLEVSRQPFFQADQLVHGDSTDAGEGNHQEGSEDDVRVIKIEDVDVTQEHLELYCENIGGPVDKIVLRPAKKLALVRFEKSEDARKAADAPDPKVDKKSIRVRLHPPRPKPREDPFSILVENLDKPYHDDNLRDYLEAALKSDHDFQKIYIKRGQMNNALVQFEKMLSQDDFDKIFKRAKRRTFQDCNISVRRVPLVSSILVQGIAHGASKDYIKLYFESQRSGGGPVRKLKMLKDDEALIYYEDYKVVETVLQQKQSLGTNELTVQRYFPFLVDIKEEDVNSEDEEMEAVDTNDSKTLACDRLILRHVKERHMDLIKSVEKSCFVTVTFPQHGRSLLIESREGNPNAKVSHAKVELRRVINSFKKEVCEIPRNIVSQVQLKSCDIVKTYKKEDLELRLDEEEGPIVIVGKEKQVTEMKQRVQEIMEEEQRELRLQQSVQEFEETDLPIDKVQLLMEFGILSEIEKKRSHLQISVGDSSVKFQGPPEEYKEAKMELLQKSLSMTENNADAGRGVLQLLKTRPDAVDQFNQHLQSRKVLSKIFIKEKRESKEVIQKSINGQADSEAETMLVDYFIEETVQVVDRSAISTDAWAAWKGEVENNHLVKLIDDEQSGILVAGRKSDVKKVLEKVKKFLSENSNEQNILRLDGGKISYLLKYKEKEITELKNKVKDYPIKCEFQPEKGTIHIAGNKQGVETFSKGLRELAEPIMRQDYTTKKPGMKKFFLSERGERSLKSIAHSHDVVVLSEAPADGRDQEEDEAGNRVSASSFSPGSQQLYYHCDNDTQQTIALYHGDITCQKVDAIVNAANSRLAHVGGLARAIVQAGGQEIQEECSQHVRKNGNVLEGHIYVSKPGKLPCRAVIHAVGPVWSTDADEQVRVGKTPLPVKLLRQACQNALESASQRNFRSLAMPAISTGVYKFPSDLAAEIIIEAVCTFFKDNPQSSLKTVHLVNQDKGNVFAEFFRKKFRGSPGFVDCSQSAYSPEAPVTLPVPRSRGSLKAAKQPQVEATDAADSADPQTVAVGGCKIVLKKANIADVKVDAIVNSTSDNLDLSKNKSAEALLKAAGPALQTECTQYVQQNGNLSAGGLAITSSGNLQPDCQHVFHVVCSDWKNGAGLNVLKTILHTCLSAADQKTGISSIAIPAIGTGNLGFPRDQVAQVTYQEIMDYLKKNPNSTLREVAIVVYPADRETVTAFEKELKQRKGKPKKRRFVRGSNQPAVSSPGCFAVGDVTVKVQQGDITEVITDAIAVISNPGLDLSGSKAGAAILKKGGDEIKKECRSLGKPKQPDDSVVVTTAGNLPCKSLFHLIGNVLKGTCLKNIVTKCLEEAERRQLKSMSFSAFGTGNLGLPAAESAYAISSAIKEFSKQAPVHVHDVRVVIYEASMVEEFTTALRDGPPKGLFEKARDFVSSILPSFVMSASDEKESVVEIETLTLHVFGGDRESVEKAIEEIQTIEGENSKNIPIEVDSHMLEDGSAVIKIMALQRKHQVQIDIEKGVGRVIVNGEATSTLSAKSEIKDIENEWKEKEREHKQADAIKNLIQWQYKEDEDWNDYDKFINMRLEKAFMKKEKYLKINAGDTQDACDFKITFDDMKEKNLKTLDVTDVRRQVKADSIAIPLNWNIPSGKENALTVVDVDPQKDSREYNAVAAPLQNTGINIQRIQRIQNPPLYKQYMINKQKMDADGNSNEMSLYHGTAQESCDKINEHGFDRNYRGKNAVVLGNGVYFAKDPRYSVQPRYSPPNMTGQRFIYQTKVLVGTYTRGQQNMSTPPDYVDLQGKTKKYDSVVDDPSNPSIFVVFRDWQCYPEYLITFT